MGQVWQNELVLLEKQVGQVRQVGLNQLGAAAGALNAIIGEYPLLAAGVYSEPRLPGPPPPPPHESLCQASGLGLSRKLRV